MKDIIAARRRAIREAAPCEYCGATLAACKAERGKDPTAPEWFGCCAHGVDMRPCHHVVDTRALSDLLDEIESGTVRTVEESTPKPSAKTGMTWSEYLDQGEQWMPKTGRMVAVAAMDPEWRFNASRWLERNAAPFASRYSFAESLDLAVSLASPIGPNGEVADQLEADDWHAAHERQVDPVGWIRTTTLYRALVADLPECSVALDAIAERSKHWSTCPARTGEGECRCEEIRAKHEAEQEEAHGVPEWTS